MTNLRPTSAILVVEDDPLIRLSITVDLADLGYEVYEAADAQEAIDQLTQHANISVLFTDIDMPGDIDGLRLAALVRDRWPPIKIIVTSGKHQLTCADIPFTGVFIPKPYTPMVVASVITDIMRP
ncbi:CheY-like chemotaxis protein [Pseudorhizobium tarimense]|uniref:CheY-like chemotaxis protein n=1 Tax=Pseudorhizobium tarimense TaxID=1079109 RepID=A0ABV2H0Z9_9HYPH|nr:response regulator [Pseudorhizobium tarimense]MCJ8517331.1 response regulator [Pseudorhizobium tarimense]